MEDEEKLELCEKYLAEDYKIDKHTIHRIIRDLEIEDVVMEYYKEVLNEVCNEQEEQEQAEFEHEEFLKHYSDRWNDHVGV